MELTRMCIDPTILPDGTQVACRNKCWQCIKNYINDYVGRCLAEQRSSTIALPVTLTYSGDSPNNAILIYDDFQKLMKRLRRRGYKVRYIVAGEYGEERGRAHWHAVLFFTGKHPEIVDHPDKINPEKPEQIFLARWKKDPWARNQWAPWSSKQENRGHVYFQPPTYEGFQYILKYVVAEKEKDIPQNEKKLGQSLKPPLGHQYFLEKAEAYVEQGIVPQNFEYTFPDVFDSKGKRRKFWLQGTSRRNFMDHYLAKWNYQYGTLPPWNECLSDYGVWDKDVMDLKHYQQEEIIERFKESIEWKTRKIKETNGPDALAIDYSDRENHEREMERRQQELAKVTVMKGHYQKIPCVVYLFPNKKHMTVQYGKDEEWQSEKLEEINRFLRQFVKTHQSKAGDLPRLQENIRYTSRFKIQGL